MYSALIDLAYQMIYSFRRQSQSEISRLLPLFTKAIEEDAELSSDIANPETEFYAIFSSLSEALNNMDYILLADNLEELFIPYIKSLMTYQEAKIFGDYSVEPSSSGFLTIKHIPTDIYLHSNCNPMDEARAIADFYFDETKAEYAVFGLGLGYITKALSELSLNAVNISVFETDIQLIEYVKSHDFLNIFTQDNVTIIHDSIGTKFLEKISDENVGSILHFPSVNKISNPDILLKFKSFYANWNSFYQQKRIIAVNFNKNLSNCPNNILCEADRFKGKNVYLVAGGPSTDANIEFLKGISDPDSIIFCVTTVLKKLVNAGITPDYAVVMDAREITYRHMSGIEDCKVPLIVDSSAFWKFAQFHKGPKFLALQNGYKPAEQIAAQNNYPLFNTFGSVTTLALDIAVQFKAKNIYFIGVDMAYPGGQSHASGSVAERKVDTSKLTAIEGTNGETVYTDELFLRYLKEIENIISEHPEINFYNLSKIGAKIKGTK